MPFGDGGAPGFLWRKYGEKTVGARSHAVKRSYYRCVTQSNHCCPARKRVDRLASSPSHHAPLSTTFINQHNHPPRAARARNRAVRPPLTSLDIPEAPEHDLSNVDAPRQLAIPESQEVSDSSENLAAPLDGGWIHDCHGGASPSSLDPLLCQPPPAALLPMNSRGAGEMGPADGMTSAAVASEAWPWPQRKKASHWEGSAEGCSWRPKISPGGSFGDGLEDYSAEALSKMMVDDLEVQLAQCEGQLGTYSQDAGFARLAAAASPSVQLGAGVALGVTEDRWEWPCPEESHALADCNRKASFGTGEGLQVSVLSLRQGVGEIPALLEERPIHWHPPQAQAHGAGSQTPSWGWSEAEGCGGYLVPDSRHASGGCHETCELGDWSYQGSGSPGSTQSSLHMRSPESSPCPHSAAQRSSLGTEPQVGSTSSRAVCKVEAVHMQEAAAEMLLVEGQRQQELSLHGTDGEPAFFGMTRQQELADAAHFLTEFIHGGEGLSADLKPGMASFGRPARHSSSEVGAGCIVSKVHAEMTSFPKVCPQEALPHVSSPQVTCIQVAESQVAQSLVAQSHVAQSHVAQSHVAQSQVAQDQVAQSQVASPQPSQPGCGDASAMGRSVSCSALAEAAQEDGQDARQKDLTAAAEFILECLTRGAALTVASPGGLHSPVPHESGSGGGLDPGIVRGRVAGSTGAGPGLCSAGEAGECNLEGDPQKEVILQRKRSRSTSEVGRSTATVGRSMSCSALIGESLQERGKGRSVTKSPRRGRRSPETGLNTVQAHAGCTAAYSCSPQTHGPHEELWSQDIKVLPAGALVPDMLPSSPGYPVTSVRPSLTQVAPTKQQELQDSCGDCSEMPKELRIETLLSNSVPGTARAWVPGEVLARGTEELTPGEAHGRQCLSLLDEAGVDRLAKAIFQLMQKGERVLSG